MVRATIYTACAIGLYCFLSDFCHKQTKGFQMGKVAMHLPFEEKWEVSLSKESEKELLCAVNQPFRYLKKGKYCYVFISQDGKHVLKLIQKSPITTPFWASLLFTDFSTLSLEKKRQKELNFTSYKEAFNNLQEQNGTLYLHLNTTSHLNKDVVLFDAIGAKHLLSLDHTPFILQRKAESFCPFFLSVLEKNPEMAKDLLKQFALSLQEKNRKGLSDKDLSPKYNLGIFDGKIVCFDLDGLRPALLPVKEQMLLDAKKMIRWLDSIDPSLSSFLKKEIVNLSEEKKTPL